MRILLHYYLFPRPSGNLDFDRMMKYLEDAGVASEQYWFSEAIPIYESQGDGDDFEPSRSISIPDWQMHAARYKYYSLSFGTGTQIEATNFIASDNQHIRILINHKMLKRMPENAQDELLEHIYNAAFLSGAAYIVKGVELSETIALRFIEIDGVRCYDPYTSTGFIDSVSAIMFSPENGGKKPEGMTFSVDDKITHGHWIICLLLHT